MNNQNNIEELGESSPAQEEMSRVLDLERFKAKKAKAKEPKKEGLVEEMKTKVLTNALSWIAVAIFDAFFDVVPTYVLRFIPIFLKAKNKSWAWIGLIFNCCIDLSGLITLSLLTPISWVLDVVAAPINIYIQIRAESES